MNSKAVRWILLSLLLLVAAIAGLGWLLFQRPTEGPPGWVRIVSGLRSGALVLENRRSDWDPEAIRAAPASSGVEPVFTESFDQELGSRWKVVENRSQFPKLPGLASTPGDQEPFTPPEVVLREGGAALSFPIPVGAVLTAVDVVPDAPYEFRARSSVGAPPADPTSRSLAGYAVILELRTPLDLDSFPLEEFTARFKEAQPIGIFHALPPEPDGGSGAIVFETSIYTHCLLVGLVGGRPDDQASGPVSFDEVAVTALPRWTYLPHQNTGQVPREEFTATVKMMGDMRDALLLPVSSSYEVELRLPDGDPVLEFGYGVLTDRVIGFGAHATRVRISVRSKDGEEQVLLDDELTPAAGFEQTGWHDRKADLSRFSGRTVRFRFSSAGPPGSFDMAAIGGPLIRSRTEPDRLSVILVSIDTLRADHLGIYGYSRPTSPFIDRFFRRQGQYLTGFVAASSFTLPSHASIFTGQYPSVHGVRQFDRRLLEGVVPSLTGALAEEGYATAAFTGGGYVGHEYGFPQGFDSYSVIDPLLTFEDPLRKRFPRSWDREYNDKVYARYDLDRVLDWVSDHNDGPFFLFLHSFVTHNYAPPLELTRLFDSGSNSDLGYFDIHAIDMDSERWERFGPEDLAHVIDFYDATIRAADAALERLVAHLEEEQLLDRTLLLVVSDHGEEFMEHGGLLHGRTLYAEQLRVPFLIRRPGVSLHGEVSGVGHHIDIAPTVFDLLGLPADPRMDGESLRAVLDGIQVEPRPLFSELHTDVLGELAALSFRNTKLLETFALGSQREPQRHVPRLGRELFDLSVDPGEQVNLAGTDHPALAGLVKRLGRLRADLNLRRDALLIGGAAQFDLTAATRERLRALGYLQVESSDH